MLAAYLADTHHKKMRRGLGRTMRRILICLSPFCWGWLGGVPSKGWRKRCRPVSSWRRCWPLRGDQVRALTHFFLFPFCGKNHRFACIANQWPLIRKIFSFSVPNINSSQTWRTFWADTAPFKGHQLASCVASGTTEKQGHRQVR